MNSKSCIVAEGTSTTPAGNSEGVFYLHQIRTTTATANWPIHIKESIVSFGGNQSRKMPLDEVGAILMHIAMLEVGFVPECVNVHPLEETIQNRMECIRRCTVGQQIPERTRKALRIKYSGVQLETDSSVPERGIYRRFVPTASVEVLMTYWDGVVDIVALLPERMMPTFLCSGVSYLMDLRYYIDPIQGLELSPTTLLNPEEWLNIIRLDGMKFNNQVKREFCTRVLDCIEAEMFETRITDLPCEILESVLKYVSKKELIELRVVSKSFRDKAEYILMRRTRGKVPYLKN